MMWNYSGMDGGNWGWMVPMMVLFVGGTIAIVALAIRAFAGSKGNATKP